MGWQPKKTCNNCMAFDFCKKSKSEKEACKKYTPCPPPPPPKRKGENDIRIKDINKNMRFESNKIVVGRDSYNSEAEMFNAIGDIIKHLTKNGEECFIYADDIGCGIYVIAHAHNNRDGDWGDNRFMFVTSDEEDEILRRREEMNKAGS